MVTKDGQAATATCLGAASSICDEENLVVFLAQKAATSKPLLEFGPSLTARTT